MVDLFMINLHMQYKVRVRFVLSWEGCVCCDTLLSDTIVLTPVDHIKGKSVFWIPLCSNDRNIETQLYLTLLP